MKLPPRSGQWVWLEDHHFEALDAVFPRGNDISTHALQSWVHTVIHGIGPPAVEALLALGPEAHRALDVAYRLGGAVAVRALFEGLVEGSSP